MLRFIVLVALFVSIGADKILRQPSSVGIKMELFINKSSTTFCTTNIPCESSYTCCSNVCVPGSGDSCCGSDSKNIYYCNSGSSCCGSGSASQCCSSGYSCNSNNLCQVNTCFSGMEILQLESGTPVSLADVRIGDRVLVSSADGKDVDYSPVVALPHGKNTMRAVMVQLSTEAGADLRLTDDHLLLAGPCGTSLSLQRAGDVKVGACVMSASAGPVRVAGVSRELVEGLYTAVTLASDKFLVVNGLVASPFAVNHLLANAYYELHRVVYRIAPWLLALECTPKVSTLFGDMIASYF